MKLSHYAVVVSLSALAFYAAITLRNEIKAENKKSLEGKIENVAPAGQGQESPYEETILRDYTSK